MEIYLYAVESHLDKETHIRWIPGIERKSRDLAVWKTQRSKVAPQVKKSTDTNLLFTSLELYWFKQYIKKLLGEPTVLEYGPEVTVDQDITYLQNPPRYLYPDAKFPLTIPVIGQFTYAGVVRSAIILGTPGNAIWEKQVNAPEVVLVRELNTLTVDVLKQTLFDGVRS